MTDTNPSDVLRACLIARGLVILPRGRELIPYIQTPRDESTVCYVSSMPDDDDQAVCIRNVAGVVFGRRQTDGQTQIHSGLKILIRALSEPRGDSLTRQIAGVIDAIPARFQVKVWDSWVLVQSIYRTSSVIALGEEPAKKRMVWSLNARIAFQEAQAFVG